MNNIGAFFIGLVLLYTVIRYAVRDGILDAKKIMKKDDIR